MGKKKYAKTPLLYIHQPTITTPEAKMQYNYMTPKKATNNVLEQDHNKVQGIPINRNKSSKKDTINKLAEKATNQNNASQTETVEIEEEVVDTEQTEVTEEEAKRPRFKDMETIEDKVDYFVNMPDSVPIKCEVKTEGRSYRGIIVDREEETVFMRVGKRSTNTKIPISEIKNVRLIGF